MSQAPFTTMTHVANAKSPTWAPDAIRMKNAREATAATVEMASERKASNILDNILRTHATRLLNIGFSLHVYRFLCQ